MLLCYSYVQEADQGMYGIRRVISVSSPWWIMDGHRHPMTPMDQTDSHRNKYIFMVMSRMYLLTDITSHARKRITQLLLLLLLFPFVCSTNTPLAATLTIYQIIALASDPLA